MFNKKEMKLIDSKKVQKYIMDGVQVFMVKLDGSLVEVTSDTNWQTLFLHEIQKGAYAIYRQKFTIGTFYKNVRLGRWSIAVGHIAKGGDEECVC